MKSILKWSLMFLLPVIALLIAGAPAHAFTIDPNHFLIIGATLGSTLPTLSDVAKRLDPNGSVAKIVELLNQTNAVLDAMGWREGNLPTGHRVTVRTGLPSVFWRLLNQGVANSKSTTAQIDEQAGMLEARGQVDVDLAMLNGNTAEFRLSEAQPFVEAMNQEFAQTLFYGAASAPEEFIGLANRYSSLSATNAQNIITGGGSGSDNSSIWLIVWGENTLHGIYPKGSKAGLVHQDLGEGDAFDGSNNRFRALMDRWQWKCGLVVKDWRYAVRIPNIDISNLVAESSAANLIKLMSRAIDRIPSMGMGRAVFYTSRTVQSMLRVQGLNNSSSAIAVQPALTQFGRPGDLTFLGIPVQLCDQILETEAAVS